MKSVSIPISEGDAKLFEPDLATWSRSLMQRLERNVDLTPQKVYLRPFQLGGDLSTPEVEAFFNGWLSSSLSASSVFQPADGKKEIYAVAPAKLKTRAIRPVSTEKGLSLTGNLVEAQSEIVGKLDLPSPPPTPHHLGPFYRYSCGHGHRCGSVRQ